MSNSSSLILVENKPVLESKLKIGLVGHFNFYNGASPDGVGRWTETIFKYLLAKGYNIEGFAVCGHSRESPECKVSYYDERDMPQKVSESNIDLAILRGSAERVHPILDVCQKKGIPTIFVMPYWGMQEDALELAKKTEILITGTEDYARALRENTKRDCRYVPWPIDCSFWTPGESDFLDRFLNSEDRKKIFKIVYAGRLGSPKKVHRLIEPFKKNILDKGYNNFRLFILGPPEGEQGELVEKEINRTGTEHSIIYQPRYFTSEEMREIYRASDAFIFPTSRETYGLSELEAISCGIPTTAPVCDSWTNYVLPSMSNLPYYPLGFRAGKIWSDQGNRITEPEHDWRTACKKLRWIYHNPKEAKAIAMRWSDFIKSTMSVESIGREIERAINDVYKKAT